MSQVDAGRSVPVQPLQPAPTQIRSEASRVVAEHLDALLSEHLLPVRTRDGDEDEPYLLAVDAAGQPVVVEVVPVLDQEALLRALRHTGRAARLSTEDLARAYRSGPARFTADLADFRRTVPATSLLSTSVHGGARLLLVCATVAAGMRDVVEFLLQPGWQVEVLQVGVTVGLDGDRLVDVSQLTRTAPARTALEPTLVQRERPAPPQPRPVGSSQEGGWVRYTTPPAGVPAAAPGAARLDPPREHDVPVEPPRRIPTVVPPPFAVRRGLSPAMPRPGAPAPPQPAPLQPAPPRTAVPAPAAPESSDAHRPRPDANSWRPAFGLPYAFTGVVPTAAQPEPRLVRVAAGLGGPSVLVWNRQRRRERYEALLHPDGVIELPDGSRHTDPDTAAVVVSSAATPVDGWSVWRVDNAHGPTLADVAR